MDIDKTNKTKVSAWQFYGVSVGVDDSNEESLTI